ncbi:MULTISPECIES: HEWD family protein [Halopenitus]|uniref:HEWD domain-containing protein n=1 Tax=Halopenitus malekzadehii TaxID=1267564 RepID=A0A1H6IK00_9EURY|nr:MULTISPECIES: HEWD family protein [Halopenitus]SEH46870.1 hypothetical protein SAMN05192561_102208 [Halopenitus malekzadehii]
MSALRTPNERVCENCGRIERWDDDRESWRVEEAGDTFCIHEWDINGDFLPFDDEADHTADAGDAADRRD